MASDVEVPCSTQPMGMQDHDPLKNSLDSEGIAGMIDGAECVQEGVAEEMLYACYSFLRDVLLLAVSGLECIGDARCSLEHYGVYPLDKAKHFPVSDVIGAAQIRLGIPELGGPPVEQSHCPLQFLSGLGESSLEMVDAILSPGNLLLFLACSLERCPFCVVALVGLREAGFGQAGAFICLLRPLLPSFRFRLSFLEGLLVRSDDRTLTRVVLNTYISFARASVRWAGIIGQARGPGRRRSMPTCGGSDTSLEGFPRGTDGLHRRQRWAGEVEPQVGGVWKLQMLATPFGEGLWRSMCESPLELWLGCSVRQ